MARILVIDDDEQMREMLQLMLESAGHQVVTAQNGRKGVKLYREEPAELIITDIIMPEKEGLETIRELKREFPRLKIIAISGGGKMGFDFLPVAQTFGAERILEKPFTKRQMLDAVKGLLAIEV